MSSKKIIETLLARRKALGETVRGLSGRIGYDHCGLMKWERNENVPSLQAAINWAEALGFEIVLIEKKIEKKANLNEAKSR